VLLNDDFGSLVKAVRHGRRVFANLRKAIAFVLAAHLPIIGLSVVPVLMGWPMILMPAHILFLQLIIDPACSIVFEAEALEAGAMRRLPRPSSAHLFDRPLLTRGLLQGAGLLLAVLAGYQLAVVLTGVPDAGRTQAFVGLVLGNLALIQANRSWSTTDRQTRHRNPAFLWITAGALALLSLALGIPAVATLFRFTAPSPTLLILAGTLTAMAWLWFSWVNVRQARLGHAD
jgi:Ca2+-transporting ATPase